MGMGGGRREREGEGEGREGEEGEGEGREGRVRGEGGREGREGRSNHLNRSFCTLQQFRHLH